MPLEELLYEYLLAAQSAVEEALCVLSDVSISEIHFSQGTRAKHATVVGHLVETRENLDRVRALVDMVRLAAEQVPQLD